MKLLLADDHDLFRHGFSMIINSLIHQSDVSTANTWSETLTMTQHQSFDIALLDLFMPSNKQWEDDLSTFIARAPQIPVCIVSSSNNHNHIHQAFKLGAKGYMHKTSSASEVKNAIFKISNGGYYKPISHLEDDSTNHTIKLTSRQREILILISKGNTNKHIARLLDIAESTVKRHVYNLFQILNANSRMDAIHIAKHQGILTAS